MSILRRIGKAPQKGATLTAQKSTTFNFSVPTSSGEMKFEVAPGTSLLFVGANGAGKTRLAVFIEDALKQKAHRISAHRALKLDPTVAKISEEFALRALHTGNKQGSYLITDRAIARWNSNAATTLLDDYNHLIQALFADQTNVAFAAYRASKDALKDSNRPERVTKFETLIKIWDRVLPHRRLQISGDDIVVVTTSGAKYSASEMSDGERATFYLIGQALMAPLNSLIIFDEPELHVHRSIMSRLWDELEATRSDCAMILVSHDLQFVASREGRKYVLRDYTPEKNWTIELVPEDTGFPEDIATLILGSRKPILFVEGLDESLDRAIYRACYPDWTIVPRGSCEEVIHAVISMRANAALTATKCSGIVDADAYDSREIEFLVSKGIAVLPVSEIENVFLLPDVLRAIASAEGFEGAALETKVSNILDELFEQAQIAANQIPVVVRYCRRRIDRALKKLEIEAAKDISTLAADYASKTAAINVGDLAEMATSSIQKAIADRNAHELLKWYDNKGILGIACKAKGTTRSQFEQWVIRALRNNSAPGVSEAISRILPPIVAS